MSLCISVCISLIPFIIETPFIQLKRKRKPSLHWQAYNYLAIAKKPGHLPAAMGSSRQGAVSTTCVELLRQVLDLTVKRVDATGDLRTESIELGSIAAC